MVDVAEQPNVTDQGQTQSDSTAPAQPQQSTDTSQDAGWSAFVQQHAANQNPVPQPSSTDVAGNDKGWQAFLEQNANKATPPTIASQIGSDISSIGSGIGEAAHVANEMVQGLGAGINNAVVGLAMDMFKTATSLPKITPNSDYEKQISDDLNQFRNSKGYVDSAAKFGSMVSDVMAPQIKSFLGQAYVDQAKITANQVADMMTTEIPKDQYGNPVPH